WSGAFSLCVDSSSSSSTCRSFQRSNKPSSSEEARRDSDSNSDNSDSPPLIPIATPRLSFPHCDLIFHEAASPAKMSGRIGGGRERSRRLEDRNSSGQSSAPPSRHLWVGNLSHSISEGDLVRPFLEFGELDSVAFQPGRSYAFINFKTDEGAIAALDALRGSPLAGNPLRIEFAKVVSLVPNLCHSLNFKRLVVYRIYGCIFKYLFSINQMVPLPNDH
ncbi:hypothetical protein EUGRSUZ_K01370, partial [Eucalyptus grandis]